MAWARVDGVLTPLDEARIPANDAGFLSGWTVFETLQTVDGEIALLDLHLERLVLSAAAARIAVPAEIAEEVRDLAGRQHGVGRIRVTLSGSGLRIVTIEPVPLDRFASAVRCVRGPFVASPFLSGAVKHGSRAGWVVAVKRAGVDEMLLVDEQGRFTEGTTCGIVAVLDGGVYTAANDERILPSTTVTTLVQLAEELGIAVVRLGPSAAGPWDGLYIASATRGLAPVVELDGESLPGWDPVGRRLARAFAESAGLG